ncbi:MAG: hypothetical protein ACFFDP_09740 [Promethearchaeota archaeon]
MASADTARILVLLGGIFTLISCALWGYSAYGVFMLYSLAEMILPGSGIFLMPMIAIWAVLLIIDLLFGILTLMWYKNIPAHKTMLIIIGILTLAGGGLFTLIGAAICPSEA